jgi:hypothetical protein
MKVLAPRTLATKIGKRFSKAAEGYGAKEDKVTE